MEPHFNVTMNEYLPLRDVVFNTLRQAILRGELKPGERLMEIQLANKLGVSRTPIREAIRKLELEGLVLMIPRKGAEVAEIREENILPPPTIGRAEKVHHKYVYGIGKVGNTVKLLLDPEKLLYDEENVDAAMTENEE